MDINAALRDIRPAVKRIAHALHRRLPPSIELDDLEQEGLIRAAKDIPRFNGGGCLKSYACLQARRGMFDYLRATHPGGRHGPAIEIVGEDALVGLAAPDDHVRDFEQRQEYSARIKRLSARQLDVVERVLDGQRIMDIAAHMGIGESRASQILAEAVSRMGGDDATAPAAFDPFAIEILDNSMPPVRRAGPPRKPKPPKPPQPKPPTAVLIERMRPTQSVRVPLDVSNLLRQALANRRIPHMVCKLSPSLVQVWREPSDAQRKAMERVR